MDSVLRYRYRYIGPVMEFDRLICSKWQGETVAVGEREAKRNLSYQFKKQTNRTINTRITLPGKLQKLETVME